MFLFTLVGMITITPELLFQVNMLQAQPDKSSLYLYINSPGGEIPVADAIAKVIADKKLRVTCYVDYAASAALQIVMPQCHRIYLHDDTRLHFHDTHMTFGAGGTINYKITKELLAEMVTLNRSMSYNITRRFGTPRCGTDCTYQMILANAQLGPRQWQWQYSKHNITVLPRSMFDRVWNITGG